MSKYTKIVATISDARCDVDFIKQLYESGMNVVKKDSKKSSTTCVPFRTK